VAPQLDRASGLKGAQDFRAAGVALLGPAHDGEPFAPAPPAPARPSGPAPLETSPRASKVVGTKDGDESKHRATSGRRRWSAIRVCRYRAMQPGENATGAPFVGLTPLRRCCYPARSDSENGAIRNC
jgi:hypothetical protein